MRKESRLIFNHVKANYWHAIITTCVYVPFITWDTLTLFSLVRPTTQLVRQKHGTARTYLRDDSAILFSYFENLARARLLTFHGQRSESRDAATRGRECIAWSVSYMFRRIAPKLRALFKRASSWLFPRHMCVNLYDRRRYVYTYTMCISLKIYYFFASLIIVLKW